MDRWIKSRFRFDPTVQKTSNLVISFDIHVDLTVQKLITLRFPSISMLQSARSSSPVTAAASLGGGSSD